MTGQSDSTASVPFGLLTKSQRFWYAELMIAAILADGEISLPEVNFIKEIIHFVKNPEQKNELLERIAKKNPPSISKPSGVSPTVLAAIFTELCLILISDAELTSEEKTFLGNVSNEFRFSDEYLNDLMDWCGKGLSWKSKQLELISAVNSSDDLKVPVAGLTDDQLNWYATTLVATIMSDSQLDASEVGFLKMAIKLVKDPAKQQELTGLVRSQTVPDLVRPPSMDRDILVRVFFEVMLIISADESLESHELAYLKQLSDLCGFSEPQHQEMIEWCQQGIAWKQAKNPLIKRCELKREDEDFGLKVFRKSDQVEDATSFDEGGTGDTIKKDEPEPEADTVEKPPPEPSVRVPDKSDALESEPNKETHAITDFNMSCFICGSTGVVKHFQLKPKSVKSAHNIFGIPIYQVSVDGVDFVDYNMCKVTICPNCFFASTQKQMFKQNPDTATPVLIAKEGFVESWKSKTDQRQSQYLNLDDEFNTVYRSLPFAVQSYQSAIESSEELARINQSHELDWHAVTLKLTLAEILMGNNQQEEAIAWLKKIHQRSVEIFKSSKKRFIKFRSGRLILLLAVYFGNRKAADNYYQYFSKFKDTRFKSLNASDQALFKKVYGEMRRAYENQEKYSKTALNGFMLADS